MATSLIRGGDVVTRVLDDEHTEVITDGAVFQRDGVIVEVGPYEDLRARHGADVELGGPDHVVMPGLVNDHHHVGLTPFQLGVPDDALEIWRRQLAPDVDPYLDTMYGALDMIRHGITSVLHIWTGGVFLADGAAILAAADPVLRAHADTGMRVGFSRFVRDQHTLVYDDDETFLATLPAPLQSSLRTQRAARGTLPLDEYRDVHLGVHERFAHADLVTLQMSPGNVQWCSDELLMTAKELAAQLDTGIHIHLQESIYQQAYGLRRWGRTPLAHLADLGFLGPEVTCGHSVWLTASDIELLGDAGALVCHSPSSNLRIKSGIAPVNQLLARGVDVAIGIDEAGLNDDRDMFQEMRLAQKLHRIPGISSPAPTSHQILRMATSNGARAMRMADRTGTLEPGKRADVILVDLRHAREPYLASTTDVVDAVLYRARGLDVDTVVIDGTVVYADGAFTRIDEHAVLTEIATHLRRDLHPYEIERMRRADELVPYVRAFYEGWDSAQKVSADASTSGHVAREC